VAALWQASFLLPTAGMRVHRSKSSLGLVVALLGVLCPLNANAGELSNHSSVKVTPIREANKVVGARISMLLKDAQGFGRAHVSLADPKLRAASGVMVNGSLEHHRATFVDPGKVHLFEPVATQPNVPQEVSFELRYGQGNSFHGGEKLDVVSSWTDARFSRERDKMVLHNWGAVYGASRPEGHTGDIQLPGGTPAP
jgi:hypothetical protein